jgi:adenylate cyclase class 2
VGEPVLASEVELKAKIGNREETAKRIIAKGGRFLREVSQDDVYFRHPCRDLRERDEALRLRREGGSCTLTFKGRRVGSGVKMREEIEAGVDDGAAAFALLKRLGFEEAFEIRKKRSIYSLEGAEVSLDSVEGLGEFMEIELILKDGEPGDGIRERLHGLAERLKVPKEGLMTESYFELLASKSSSSRASK